MFFIKKLISPFFYPLSLILMLLLGGLFLLFFTSRQKLGKALILAGSVILVLCSYTPSADIFINPLKEQYMPYINDVVSSDKRPEYVVVLGSGNTSNLSMPVLSRISYDSLIRLMEGIRIYHMLTGSKLVLSGGSSQAAGSSANDMAQIAKDMGISEQDIIVEAESRDTKDEARLIKSIVGNSPFVLVTSSSHMPRSVALFSGLGMKPIPAPTRSIEARLLSRQPSPFFPSSVNIQKAEMAVHEYLGLIWAKLRGQI